MDVYAENVFIKQKFEEMGLDICEVCGLLPSSIEEQNIELIALLGFVHAYKVSGDECVISGMRDSIPSIILGKGTEDRWGKFESWVCNCRLGAFLDYNRVPGSEDCVGLESIKVYLGQYSLYVDFLGVIPPGLACRYLKEELCDEVFLSKRNKVPVTVTGCDGYCPGCFQRPWCQQGREESWKIDRKHGVMVIPEIAKEYLDVELPSINYLVPHR